MSATGCLLCPRECGVDRRVGLGFCGAPQTMTVSRAGLHMWEEPCISGTNGSGAVFFSGCGLRCVFCQNYQISSRIRGREVSPRQLTDIFRRLEDMGAHNINLVTPTHYTEPLLRALELYRPSVPVIWNSSGYEKVQTLRRLEGLVDVYLPDIKYYDDAYAVRYSAAEGYFKYASAAAAEMARQTGAPVFKDGLLVRGTLIRHLVLPSAAGQAVKILSWVRRELPDAAFSLMAQYFPSGQAARYPELNRRLRRREYALALRHMLALGFEYGYYQRLGSASEEFVPDFGPTGGGNIIYES